MAVPITSPAVVPDLTDPAGAPAAMTRAPAVIAPEAVTPRTTPFAHTGPCAPDAKDSVTMPAVVALLSAAGCTTVPV